MALVTQTFSDIITFTRASSATYFDATGTLQAATTNTPRFDYDPITRAAKGLLIEEARTNSIRNNTMVGAVAGTPGTLPTNWISQNIGGIALTEIVGTGTEDGIAYVDVRYTGTTSSTALGGVLVEQTTQIAALSGQTWASSFFLRIVGGSTANISDIANSIQERDAGGALLASTNTTVTPTGAALNTQRFSTTRTLNNASTAFVGQRISLTPVSGAAIDITLRIGLPQLEIGVGSSVNSGTASGTTTAVVLSAGSATDDIYNGNTLFVNGEYRTITDYVGSTKTATVAALTASPSGAYSVLQPASAAFATSVIPTTSSAVTRAADVASVNTLSPWYNAAEGTLYAEFTASANANTVYAAISNGTINQNSTYIDNDSGVIRNVVFSGSSAQAVMSTGAIGTVGAVNKIAAGYKVNDFGVSRNGAAAVTDTSGVVPVGATVLTLGRNPNAVASTYIGGYLRRITYWPRRLANSELQAVTS